MNSFEQTWKLDNRGTFTFGLRQKGGEVPLEGDEHLLGGPAGRFGEFLAQLEESGLQAVQGRHIERSLSCQYGEVLQQDAVEGLMRSVKRVIRLLPAREYLQLIRILGSQGRVVEDDDAVDDGSQFLAGAAVGQVSELLVSGRSGNRERQCRCQLPVVSEYLVRRGYDFRWYRSH